MISQQMNSAKTDLELNCRAAAKEVKTFVREKNLELNAAQHEGYKELRGIRSGMEETVTSSRREVRECTSEGKEKVRFLREEEVGPAVAITTEFRGRVGELERLAGSLMAEIIEFPRIWQPTVLVHGLPLAGEESFQDQGRAVAGLLGRVLGLRQQMVIVELCRLQPTRCCCLIRKYWLILIFILRTELGGMPPLHNAYIGK